MMRWRECIRVCVYGLLVAALSAAPVLAQSNSVDLSGQIFDPQGALVAGAKVTIKNLATQASRTQDSSADGRYTFVGLPPGRYELSVEKSGFAKLVNPELVLTIGQAAQFDAHLAIATGTQVVTVTEAADLIETRRTAVSESVDTRQINNLPINGRNYVNFTLINSQAARDSAPSIGAAPTSGLNFGGQRARSNQVSVDGADAVDNSTNGIRTTVSQEAVQEFQLIISGYMPEFGRATGGVVNIITKAGSNEIHGNVFGFYRGKNLQARNPFSVEVDPTTGAQKAVKQGYTRAQYGVTIGGPIKKDKTFYFFAWEGTRRHETGFTNIGANNFGLDPATGLTPAQAAFVANPGVPAAFRTAYAALAGSASSVAIRGIDPGLISMAGPGARFPLPVPCTPLTLTPIPCGASGLGLAPLPASFVPLAKLIGNYPVKEGTDIYSLRLDHIWNTKNATSVRANVAPSLVTGVQVNAQNQNFGENAGSRTSLNQFRDLAIVGQHTTTITNNLLNEFRFQFARRGLHYGFSQFPGGDQVANNITGFAFFGREPFSTVDRIERRWQWTDNLSWVKGKHTLKTGVDVNLIQLRSKKSQIFQLNFGGLYNFGSIDPTPIMNALVGVALPGGYPQLNAVQAYGAGLPQVFIQGVGNSNSPLDNKTLGLFFQDSWRMSPRLTLNYGVRYDIEFTPTFTPFGGPSGVNAAAEKALKVVEGLPVYDKGIQPRIGIAWDPLGDGKTVVRAGYGIFYDHPLLAVAFDSTTADGARSSQLVAPGGGPTAVPVLSNPVSVLNAATLFQGVLNTATPPAFPFTIPYLANQQRFDPFDPKSIFINENYLPNAAAGFPGFPTPILPFTLPVAANFKYGYSQQVNLVVERNLGKDFKLSAAYTLTRGVHLNRPRNVNTSNPATMVANFANSAAAGRVFGSPVTVQAPLAPVASTPATCGINVIAPGVLGALTGCPAPIASLNGQFVSTAAVFNFYRPSGPNPSFAGLFPAGYGDATTVGSEVFFAGLAGYPTGTPGVIVPLSDVLQQESSGNSTYHGFTVNLEKRFSHNFQFLASYTWSHAIDDSTDLQTLLAPQNNNRPDLERGNSTFDQRHRFVFSGVLQSPYRWKDSGFWRKLIADSTLSPLIEFSSGRPFTVLTGTDYNLDFGSNTDRPSVIAPGAGTIPAGLLTATSAFIPGKTFSLPTVCPTPSIPGLVPPAGCTGSLGRNAFTRPGYASWDLRVSRKFYFGERANLEAMVDAFNLFNRFNVGDVNPLCDPGTGSTCFAGQPSAALDPRVIQIGVKINF